MCSVIDEFCNFDIYLTELNQLLNWIKPNDNIVELL